MEVREETIVLPSIPNQPLLVKIFYNVPLPNSWFVEAVTVENMIFTRYGPDNMPQRLKYHEAQHVLQYKTKGTKIFLVRYFAAYFTYLALFTAERTERGMSLWDAVRDAHKAAYESISFEKEAREIADQVLRGEIK